MISLIKDSYHSIINHVESTAQAMKGHLTQAKIKDCAHKIFVESKDFYKNALIDGAITGTLFGTLFGVAAIIRTYIDRVPLDLLSTFKVSGQVAAITGVFFGILGAAVSAGNYTVDRVLPNNALVIPNSSFKSRILSVALRIIRNLAIGIVVGVAAGAVVGLSASFVATTILLARHVILTHGVHVTAKQVQVWCSNCASIIFTTGLFGMVGGIRKGLARV